MGPARGSGRREKKMVAASATPPAACMAMTDWAEAGARRGRMSRT